jgi:starvation-inducible DNA-binding protein
METEIIKGLEKGLSETYMQYVNIQKCHWNVEGPRFHSLHVMFEEQYQKLAEYIDILAERIRALDEYAPGSFSEFLAQSSIPEIKPRKIEADEMVHLVVSGYETLVSTLRDLASTASKNGDPETEDIVIGMNEVHQKNMWMLRSILSDKS